MTELPTPRPLAALRQLPLCAAVLLAVLSATPTHAQNGPSAPDSAPAAASPEASQRALLGLSLEELLAREVTTAAKKPQRVADTAAAIYVITQDDIARSGARSVPDLLAQVPGLEVTHTAGNGIQVSARGFNARYASGLLVMVDGAAIYGTSVGGMFWDQALMPLQDIERIEIIRGPGGTLWGSNATDGVINIITRQSIDTQGLRADVKAGGDDQRAELSYGRQLGDALSLRAYGSFVHDRGPDLPQGHTIDQTATSALVGLRFDYAPNAKDSIMALVEFTQGHAHDPELDVTGTPTAPAISVDTDNNPENSHHLLARWHHAASDDFDLTAQAYFDDAYRVYLDTQIARQLYDTSLEGRWRINAIHELNFGLSGRISHDMVAASDTLDLVHNPSTDRWLTFYAQDEIALAGPALHLTLGSKFEDNNFTGLSAQPSARLFWRLSTSLGLWAAASHAVRTPLLQERDMIANFLSVQQIPGIAQPIPVIESFIGQSTARPETLNALEAGARAQLPKGWSLDLALFYNRYQNLTTANMIAQPPGLAIINQLPVPVLSFNEANSARGLGWGGELLLSGPVLPGWKTEFSWSQLALSITVPAGQETSIYAVVPADPCEHTQLRWKNTIDLGDRLGLTTMLHYTSRSFDGQRPAYTELDLRAAWRPSAALELGLTGSNLLHARHIEYIPFYVPEPTVAAARRVSFEARLRL